MRTLGAGERKYKYMILGCCSYLDASRVDPTWVAAIGQCIAALVSTCTVVWAVRNARRDQRIDLIHIRSEAINFWESMHEVITIMMQHGSVTGNPPRHSGLGLYKIFYETCFQVRGIKNELYKVGLEREVASDDRPSIEKIINTIENRIKDSQLCFADKTFAKVDLDTLALMRGSWNSLLKIPIVHSLLVKKMRRRSVPSLNICQTESKLRLRK